MTTAELRGKFRDVFGEDSRSGHKEWLIKRIAWRMQANAEGGLTERAKRRALELANDADLRMKAPRVAPRRVLPMATPTAASNAPPPPPGSMITRPYKGR